MELLAGTTQIEDNQEYCIVRLLSTPIYARQLYPSCTLCRNPCILVLVGLDFCALDPDV